MPEFAEEDQRRKVGATASRSKMKAADRAVRALQGSLSRQRADDLASNDFLTFGNDGVHRLEA